MRFALRSAIVVLSMRAPRRAISLPSSHSSSSATAGTSAQPNCCASISVVPSSRWNTSIWVTSTASTNSPSTAQFICLLSNVAIVKTDPVSLRHSNAATIRQSANDVNAIEWPTSRLP